MLHTSEIRQFRKKELLRGKLGELLADPTLQMALKAIEQAAIPKSIPEQRPGIPYDSTLAHEWRKAQGIAEAITTLRGMTWPIDLAPEEQEAHADEFEHALPPEFQEANRPKQ